MALFSSWQICVGIIAQSDVRVIKAIHTIRWDPLKETAAWINLERNLEPAEIFFSYPDTFFEIKKFWCFYSILICRTDTVHISWVLYSQIAGYLKLCFPICYLFSVGNQKDIAKTNKTNDYDSTVDPPPVLFVI